MAARAPGRLSRCPSSEPRRGLHQPDIKPGSPAAVVQKGSIDWPRAPPGLRSPSDGRIREPEFGWRVRTNGPVALELRRAAVLLRHAKFYLGASYSWIV